ncbi:MAG: type II toxin-antitoxin system ParD family antitoxin [Planctomycetota bacterium]
MPDGVNVRLSGPLRRFIEERSGPEGTYESASEYIRDLVRRDFEREEERRWAKLVNELKPGMNAAESEFEAFDPEALIAEARAESRSNEA